MIKMQYTLEKIVIRYSGSVRTTTIETIRTYVFIVLVLVLAILLVLPLHVYIYTSGFRCMQSDQGNIC